MEVTMPPSALILKGIFLAHLILTVWGSYSDCFLGTTIVYNAAFLFLVLWSLLHRECEESPLMALLLNILSILLDITNMIFTWPSKTSSLVRFGLGMAILNLFLRPITSLLLYRVLQERAGSYSAYASSGFDRIFGGTRRSPYEDIDQPAQTNPTAGQEPEHGHGAGTSPNENLFTT